jgi:hypothetical protein
MKAGVGAVALAVVALLVSTGPASADFVGVEEFGCSGVSAIVKVPWENVDPLVPDEFDVSVVAEDSKTGQRYAGVVIGANHCDTVRVSPPRSEQGTTYATFRVAIDALGDAQSEPDHIEGGQSYTFWIATDNRDLVRFYRDRGRVTDRQAVYVTDLYFAFDLLNFTFKAPSAPSPFTMTARVGPAATGPLDLAVHFRSAVPTGVMVQDPDSINGFRFGDVSGVVEPTAGSEMARVFCGSPGTFDGDPVRVLAGDPLASVRYSFETGWFAVSHRKQDTGPTDRATCPPRT